MPISLVICGFVSRPAMLSLAKMAALRLTAFKLITEPIRLPIRQLIPPRRLQRESGGASDCLVGQQT
jgi:hypothetical protein